MARFVVHRHSTGRTHFDLRLIQGDDARSWSLLKEPPARTGESRLAVARETFSAEAIRQPKIEEEAFGAGRASVWDEGEVQIALDEPARIILILAGTKLSGRYDLKRMSWYPGNRWLLQKSGVVNAKIT
jgi:hypothetical protein